MFWNKQQEEAEAEALLKRLDGDASLEPTVAVAAKLKQIPLKECKTDPFFKARLRRQLLIQYDQQSFLHSKQRHAQIGKHSSSLVRARLALLLLAMLCAVFYFQLWPDHRISWLYRGGVETRPMIIDGHLAYPVLGGALVTVLPWLWLSVLVVLGLSALFLASRYLYATFRPTDMSMYTWSNTAYRGVWLGSILAVLLVSLTSFGTNLQITPRNLVRMVRFQSPLVVAPNHAVALRGPAPRLEWGTAQQDAIVSSALEVAPNALEVAPNALEVAPNARAAPMRAPIAAATSVDTYGYRFEQQYSPADSYRGTEIQAAEVAPASALVPTIGFATGGAKDTNNFRENIEQGYLPLPSDVTVEGLFYDYYFNTGQQAPCDQLFCPSYSQAVSRDPISGEPQQFLAVGLNSGIRAEDFARKRLNLVIVLDISSSMAEQFTNYYYDTTSGYSANDIARAQQWAGKSKLRVATEAIAALINHLRPDDQLAIVLFDDQAHLAKPLRLVGETDIARLKTHVLALEVTGNTNVEAGYRMAGDILTAVADADPTVYENRMIVLTDAQPNTGALNETSLAGLVESNAGQRIYTTFVGIGVDFNSTLVEGISKARGANYYTVHSPLDFIRRMDDEFDFMVTPLLFDLTLTFNSPDYEIAKVYGSPVADAASGELMRINTLFPSASRGGESKGGLVLLQLRARNDNASAGGAATLTVTYADRSGKLQSSVATILLPATNRANLLADHYDNDGIRKGILLVRYANLLRNWINDSRAITAGIDDWIYPSVNSEEGIVIPSVPNLGQWERQSLPLQITPEYRALFESFRNEFTNEMATIGDETLAQEVKILDRLRQ